MLFTSSVPIWTLQNGAHRAGQQEDQGPLLHQQTGDQSAAWGLTKASKKWAARNVPLEHSEKAESLPWLGTPEEHVNTSLNKVI